VIEPFLKWTKFVQFAEYQEYVEASNKDKLIPVLSEANNMYRTLLSLFLCLSLLKVFEFISLRFQCLNNFTSEIAIAGLLSLFAFSYRKQTNYITKRVLNAKERNEFS
jgi:hypothetical protein